METKVVLTHWGALRGKYGDAGLARIRRAVDGLARADAERGIKTRAIGLDDAQDMRPFRVQPMGVVDDREGAKRTVDAIDRKLLPHYLLILGGPDVVPMQRLENLMGRINAGSDGDNDPYIDSDLPYACDMPFSTDPADFQGPTRAVGRLPDVPGERAPARILELLKRAAAAKALPPEEYARWFGISTHMWRKSSRLTLERVFGDARGLAISPPARSTRWTKAELAPRIHFVNCHGGLNDPAFYGEGPDDEPEALHSSRLKGRITPGTILVAECCYGAQVYSPRARRGATQVGHGGIACEYLRYGAYGVFGATTVAYGPLDHNNYADVICRLFLESVRKGASLGRAALEARQAYAKYGRWLNPIKLKTLAQFYLLGDPSIHPVRLSGAAAAPTRRRSANVERLVAEQRKRRRERLRAEGAALAAASESLREDGISADVRDQMLRIAEEFAMRGKLVRFFTTIAAKAEFDKGTRTPRARAAGRAVAVLIEALNDEQRAGGKARGPRYQVLIGEVRQGRLVATERVVSR